MSSTMSNDQVLPKIDFSMLMFSASTPDEDEDESFDEDEFEEENDYENEFAYTKVSRLGFIQLSHTAHLITVWPVLYDRSIFSPYLTPTLHHLLSRRSGIHVTSQ